MTLKECRAFSKPTFIKPASGKLFDAKVYESGAELPSADSQDDDTPVLISEPVIWEKEFRCFIRERQLMTLSAYSQDGELNLDATEADILSAQKFCQTLLADNSFELPPSIVVDVGIIEDKGWAVVEANPVFASGIYNCDPTKVLDCLSLACMPLHNTTEDLKQWVVNEV